MKKRRFGSHYLTCLLFGLLWMPWSVYANASTSDWIAPYPESRLVHEEIDEEIRSRRMVLGMLKKINNVIVPDSERYLMAQQRSATYLITSPQAVEVVQTFFLSQLKQAAEVLFDCKGRECGRSNHWANQVFKQSVLYGPDKYQRYIVVRLAREPVAYGMLYIAQRGNGKIYAHIVILSNIQSVSERDLQEMGQDVLAEILMSQGYYVFRPAQLTAGGEISVLVQALAQVKGEFALVGHSGLATRQNVPDPGNISPWIEDEMLRTEQLAERVKRSLITAGVASERLSAWGVGPLIPANEPGRFNESTGQMSILKEKDYASMEYTSKEYAEDYVVLVLFRSDG